MSLKLDHLIKKKDYDGIVNLLLSSHETRIAILNIADSFDSKLFLKSLIKKINKIDDSQKGPLIRALGKLDDQRAIDAIIDCNIFPISTTWLHCF